MANSRKREKNGIKNFKDIAMKCVRILKKERRCKRKESSISETNTPRRTDEGLKSKLTLSHKLEYNVEKQGQRTRRCLRKTSHHHKITSEVMSKWYASCVILRLEKRANQKAGRSYMALLVSVASTFK